MASAQANGKNVTVNPLKMSQPLGGATAFMGLNRCLPMLHAAQGCTAFALVLLVRHFREAIPFQTTAMSEVTTILGGADNLEQAIVNIVERAHPDVIGICSNGLIEARGEDIKGDLKAIRARHPELARTALIYARTPDYKGGFQDGWAAAVEATIDQLVEPLPGRNLRQVNVLAGCHLTPADIDEIRDTIEAFGLAPIILPDISGSLDGHVADEYVATTQGGTSVKDIRGMGRSVATLALGQQMEPAARLLETRCGVPVDVFSRLTGLLPWDNFIAALARISRRPVPQAIRRRRSQLIDAMLDGHFFFGEKKVAIAAEPDLLTGLSCFLNDMGATITTAVTTSQTPALAAVPSKTVTIGDLDDLETGAAGCDLMIAHSHGARVAERLGIPFFRAGFPNFDRLGAAHQLSVGYSGTRDLIFELGNLFIAGNGGMHATTASH
ncbi:nitrogenase iron-molybdenum cofactor biosynthesis protein NifN [Rhizomicrobium electricum]|uniref:Nitrogenase iron-molybdenum cofactor biosynthesis protein NifN n=1 Tax=Rhizomicrobium electricum TaxID=480070 RepID=A0ABN1F342_9PROT|nr:nitrogenase iron-molybdenum cofactor biosynthesis protein NifN [Rhizomicrobium electricum]NIJ50352.1 nitrogenase molybdenum-iron protein NifN [Rhizomicrobium electricum]